MNKSCVGKKSCRNIYFCLKNEGVAVLRLFHTMFLQISTLFMQNFEIENVIPSSNRNIVWQTFLLNWYQWKIFCEQILCRKETVLQYFFSVWKMKALLFWGFSMYVFANIHSVYAEFWNWNCDSFKQSQFSMTDIFDELTPLKNLLWTNLVLERKVVAIFFFSLKTHQLIRKVISMNLQAMEYELS